ncbi:MAG: agmatinase, partial [Gemmatimonadota bacterium]
PTRFAPAPHVTRPDLPPELAGHPWAAPYNFLELSHEEAAWDRAAAVVLPIPYEATVSWGSGTRDGPAAILDASRYVELYDEELDASPYEIGVCTLPAVELSGAGPEEAVAQLRALYDDLLEAAGDRLVIGLGGEHSISSAPAMAWAERLGDELSILQLDAHSDLRAEYRGTPWNHACVMRRVLERTERIVAVGIRALTVEERAVIRAHGIETVFAHEMRRPGWVERALDALAPRVYLTFDLDFFDPSIVPATGTPEPGGPGWWDAMELLAAVFRERDVVGADVVELAPRRGEEASAFTAAKLVYKMIGYWSASRAGD